MSYQRSESRPTPGDIALYKDFKRHIVAISRSVLLLPAMSSLGSRPDGDG